MALGCFLATLDPFSLLVPSTRKALSCPRRKRQSQLLRVLPCSPEGTTGSSVPKRLEHLRWILEDALRSCSHGLAFSPRSDLLLPPLACRHDLPEDTVFERGRLGSWGQPSVVLQTGRPLSTYWSQPAPCFADPTRPRPTPFWKSPLLCLCPGDP